MVITEEIIAAYVEGKVSEAERKEVRRYLVQHPEMQDIILALMNEGGNVAPQRKTELREFKLASGPSFTGIGCGSVAACVPYAEKALPEGNLNSVENKLKKRRKRMMDFFNEL